jgi:hypothetical protein
VVDVAHDGHHWRARHQRIVLVDDVEQSFLDVGLGHAFDGVPRPSASSWAVSASITSLICAMGPASSAA